MKKVSNLIAVLVTMCIMLTGCGEQINKGVEQINKGVDSSPSDITYELESSEATFCGVDDVYGNYIDSEYYEFEDFNTEEYTYIDENGFVNVSENPLSTFAADVDTGSYCNLRRMINNDEDLENVSKAIRTEEIVNYFDYDVDSKGVFGLKSELSTCPWNEENDLLVMTVQANSDNAKYSSKGNNFVFLIDVSGSMDSRDCIEMAVKSFKLLASTLEENDRVSVVTYSGESDLLLEGSNSYRDICKALDKAEEYCKNYGGGTNGSGGIEAAYKCAEKNFIAGGNNRVIIASDGDMNLGITSESGLVDLITEKKESGVFLTVLGYGYGNYSDVNMESLADYGNGNYYYIDNIDEAERVLVDKLKQTTVTVAKDVKFQAEFNPAVVKAYRQIGYENRQMSASDFNNDKKDGGEVGAGQQVTVVYEVEYNKDNEESTSNLKYQESQLSDKASSGDILTLSIRYKDPSEDESKLIKYEVNPKTTCVTDDFDFVAGIVEASMVLRDSEYKGNSTLNRAYSLALSGSREDKYRVEFCELLQKLGARLTEDVIISDRSDVGRKKSEEKEAYNENELAYYLIKYDKLSDIIDILDNFDNSEIMSLTKKQDFMEIGIIFDSKSDEDRFLKEVTSNLSENKRFKGIEKIEK